MDKQPEAKPKKEEQQQNGQPKIVVKEEVSVTVTETHEETDEEAQKRYEEALKKYELEIAQVKAFGNELKELFHKSQDTFEKQLSYISTGALALSVGFIKDIVRPIKDSSHKWMLILGWGLLIFTLLFNLISHMLAGKYAKKGAKETEDIDNMYDPKKIEKRSKLMNGINWTTVFTLASGIILIVMYIIFNAIL